jgi:hypothetical protein
LHFIACIAQKKMLIPSHLLDIIIKCNRKHHQVILGACKWLPSSKRTSLFVNPKVLSLISYTHQWEPTSMPLIGLLSSKLEFMTLI